MKDNIVPIPKIKDYSNEVNEVLLMSTIPRVTYVNSDGNETIFIGYSVNQLILEDVYIRQNATFTLNVTNLENGIESEIRNLARNLIDSKYSFRINITSYRVKPILILSNNNNNNNNNNITQKREEVATSYLTLWSLDQKEEIDIRLQLFFEKKVR